MMARPKGPHRPLTVIAEAVRRYVVGDPVDDIAKLFGVTQPTVSYWVKHYGKDYGGPKFKRRSRGRRKILKPSMRDQEIIFRASQGEAVCELAKVFNLTDQRISYIVCTWRRRGWQPQPVKVKNISDYLQATDGLVRSAQKAVSRKVA